MSCHGRNYSQPYFFKRNQSSDNRSLGFGAKFLLKKLSASDFSYERKSALRGYIEVKINKQVSFDLAIFEMSKIYQGYFPSLCRWHSYFLIRRHSCLGKRVKSFEKIFFLLVLKMQFGRFY